MSERIKQIAERAKNETYVWYSNTPFEWSDWHRLYNEIFAQILLEECKEVIEKFEGHEKQIALLKNHFSVEM